MKNVKLFLVMGLVFGSINAYADAGLSDQLSDLKMPENMAPVGLRSERLYSAQVRDTELAHRFEFDLGGAKNLTSNGFLNQTQINLTARYHLDNRWDVSVSGAYGYNSFTDAANRLMAENNMLPDAAIVKTRFDALLGYNLFYGKFRMNMDNVFYFDQYVSVGPGLVTTQYNTAVAGVADVGFALNFGNNWTARFGAKNDFFTEQKAASSGLAYHLLGHVDIGYLIGGESHYE